MPDTFDPATRSRVMASVRSANTKPEWIVRRTLFAAGFRYRLHRRDLPGSPDLVLSGLRAVVFVHGCFWHGHDCRRGARIPATNVEYWKQKIAGNRRRDRRNARLLRAQDWSVYTVWECAASDSAKRVARALARRRLQQTVG